MKLLRLPFQEPTELLICGSTLTACELAVQAARAGVETTLAMERVNPFFERVATLRSWVEDEPDSHPQGLLAELLSNEVVCEKIGKKIYFNPSAAVRSLEGALCDSGVTFFYNTAPAMALASEGSLEGVVFGGKTGLFAIPAEAVVDATASATVARAAGVAFEEAKTTRELHYTIELSKPVEPRVSSYNAAGLEVRVAIHHRYASFIVELPSGKPGPLGEIEEFRRAASAILAFEYRGEERRFRSADGYLISGESPARTLHGCGQVGEFPNLFLFGPRGVPGASRGNILLEHPEKAKAPFARGLEVIRHMLPGNPPELSKLRLLNAEVDKSTPAVASDDRRDAITDPGFDEPGMILREVEWTPPAEALRVPLVIAGTGTSGIAAAWHAGKKRMNAMGFDRGLEPGGTNTLGGVTKLWYGKDTPAFRNFYEEVGAKNNGLNAVPFARALERHGVPFYPNLAATGVSCLEDRIACVYAVAPQGLIAIGGDQFIDATGDGSLAAWAGSPYGFGGGQDETTLWGSFAYFQAGDPEARRPFLSPCDERSAADATRFIVSMRRNAKVEMDVRHTPVPFYLAPRESRHIRGGRTVTYLDVLSGRRFRSGVLRAESNLDIKGIATSDAAKAGFIPEYWQEVFAVSIPYEALTPVSLANTLVVGKAYSITHDALAMARMQRDLFVMGMVAIEAARQAQSVGGRFDRVSVPALQEALMGLGALSKDDIAQDDFGFEMDAAGLARAVAGAAGLEEALVPSARLAVLGNEIALAALAAHAEQNSGALNRLRCYLGNAPGAERVAMEIQGLLAGGIPQELYHGRQSTPHFMPDQGYAPLPALMLGNLGRSGAEGAAHAMALMGDRLDPDACEWNARWGYLFAYANACEASPGNVFIPHLKRFISSRSLQNVLTTRRDDPRKASDPLLERHGYLRLALTRALVRCGSGEGGLGLCDFLDEARLPWARSARALLRALSGVDHGYDGGAWREWIKAHGATFPLLAEEQEFR